MRRRKGLDDLATAIEQDNAGRQPSASAVLKVPNNAPPAVPQPKVTSAEPDPPSAARRGRPPVDTVGIHLRLGRELDEWLQDQAIDESRRRRKTITKQNMILQLLEQVRKTSSNG